MDIGIFAKTFRRDGLPATLDAVLNSGLTTTQFNLAVLGGPSPPDEIPAPTVREETRRRGLEMAAVSGTYNMAHPDAGVRADGQRRLGKLIADAPVLGAHVVTLCTGSRDPRRHVALFDHLRLDEVTLGGESTAPVRARYTGR